MSINVTTGPGSGEFLSQDEVNLLLRGGSPSDDDDSEPDFYVHDIWISHGKKYYYIIKGTDKFFEEFKAAFVESKEHTVTLSQKALIVPEEIYTVMLLRWKKYLR